VIIDDRLGGAGVGEDALVCFCGRLRVDVGLEEAVPCDVKD
jgi:hypothetical protein